MHEDLVEAIVATCRQRAAQGDCPTVGRPSGDSMEQCIVDLAKQRDEAGTRALRTLAIGVMKFAPDLAAELVKRWTGRDEALNEFLSMILRDAKVTK